MSPDQLNQTFLPERDNGTLCVSLTTLTDTVIEPPEVLLVLLNSTDEDVVITRESLSVTIGDTNIGSLLTSG